MTETKTYVEPIVRMVSVMRSRFASANGGLSEHTDEVVLYPSGTFAYEVEPKYLGVAVTIERGNSSGTIIAVPVLGPDPAKSVGPMASGAYLATSDSRFRTEVERVLNTWGQDRHARFYGAVALHDRFETPEQYRALST